MPLVTGSLIDRVHKLGRACIHQGLLHHCGRGLLFVAILSDEWSIVRLSLTSGAICSVAFHFLFPFPRPARMAWASVFAVGHLCALYRECKENLPVSLTDDERQLYAQCFEPVGFTPWHFRQIMALAKPVRLEPGDVLCEECEPVETVALLLEGSVNTTWRRDAELGEPSYQLKKRDRAAWDAAKVHHGAPVRVAAPAKGGGAQQPAGDSLNSLNQLPVWVRRTATSTPTKLRPLAARLLLLGSPDDALLRWGPFAAFGRWARSTKRVTTTKRRCRS